MVLSIVLLVLIAINGQFYWSLTLTFLTVACILSEWRVIRLPQGDSLTLSIVFILLALVFVFGEATTPVRQAVGALEVITVGSLVGYGLTHRPPPLRLAFYVAHHILSAGIAGIAFVIASSALPQGPLQSFHVAAVAIYVVVISLISMLLIGPINRRIIKEDKCVIFYSTSL